jgi:hypothetical protein
MKKFILMHVGFEPPTPEIMGEWEAWFKSIANRTVENVGLGRGREITKSGAHDLTWDLESITGFSVIEAESLEEAEELARTNPFITSIRVYEVRSG